MSSVQSATSPGFTRSREIRWGAFICSLVVCKVREEQGFLGFLLRWPMLQTKFYCVGFAMFIAMVQYFTRAVRRQLKRNPQYKATFILSWKQVSYFTKQAANIIKLFTCSVLSVKPSSRHLYWSLTIQCLPMEPSSIMRPRLSFATVWNDLSIICPSVQRIFISNAPVCYQIVLSG